MVVFGKVSLEICAPGVRGKQILTLGAGDLLGWSSLLGEARYMARARTPQPARLAEINVAQLVAILKRDPAFGYELMHRTALAKRPSSLRPLPPRIGDR